jgi:hypothetical protein
VIDQLQADPELHAALLASMGSRFEMTCRNRMVLCQVEEERKRTKRKEKRKNVVPCIEVMAHTERLP